MGEAYSWGVADYKLDPSRSTLTLRTRSGGFFGALAHDLELTAPLLRGHAKLEGDRWDGEVVVEPTAIRVIGAIKKGQVDRSVLSANDVREIERRLVDHFGGAREVVVRGTGTVDRPEVRVTVSREGTARVKAKATDEGDARVVAVTGTVSMKALGLGEVKGPLGAFVIKDDVEVEGRATFVPA
ncbi:MAG: hypothetical protein HYV09_00675 [Deltaproteobacteria bacterium]|nr:hypothetical protein [Deltaproteobacteria bacterium]